MQWALASATARVLGKKHQLLEMLISYQQKLKGFPCDIHL